MHSLVLFCLGIIQTGVFSTTKPAKLGLDLEMFVVC